MDPLGIFCPQFLNERDINSLHKLFCQSLINVFLCTLLVDDDPIKIPSLFLLILLNMIGEVKFKLKKMVMVESDSTTNWSR